MFCSVATNDSGIEFAFADGIKSWEWPDIEKVEKIKRSDPEYTMSFGIGGVRLVNRLGDTVVVFDTIQGFADLVDTVTQKTQISLSS